MVFAKPRILFYFESYTHLNTGIGGHYRSVQEFSKTIGRDYDVSMVSFGDLPSPVLMRSSNYTHINNKSFSFFSRVSALRRYLGATYSNEDMVVIFPVGSLSPLLVCEVASLGYEAHVALVKPGGPPKNYLIPYSRAPVMTFHAVDYELFIGADRKRPVGLVVGRVSPPIVDEIYLKEFEEAFPRRFDKVRILVICRIAEEKESALVSIAKQIASIGFDGIDLCYIGYVQDKELLQRLKAIAPEATFLTDKKFTDDASRALHGVDVACVIGRTAMEAMACGRPVFVPVRSADYGGNELCAVSLSNWTVFSRHNFSNRISLDELPGFISLVDAYKNKERLSRLADESAEIYMNNLSPEASAAEWLRFIDSVVGYRPRKFFLLFSLIFNSLVSVKGFFRRFAR